MTKTAAEALQAYEDLYKIPGTERYIIDGDEAQVAADLAAVLRAQQPTGVKQFRAVYMPQVPHEAIAIETDDLITAAIALEAMVQLSIFEFEHKIKPDYSDMASIEQRDSDGEWEDVDEDDWPELDKILTTGPAS